MTTTTLRAALARIDWAAIGHRIDTGIRYVTITAQLLLAAATIAWEVAYEHRAQIRQALIHAIAAVWLAGRWTRRQAERTYLAGQWTRRQIDRLGQLGAVLLQLTPLEAMVAAREALERLVRRLYPVLA